MKTRRQPRLAGHTRAGLSTVDYVLTLGVVLPLVGFMLWVGPRMIQLVYEVLCTMVAWPFM